MKAFPSAAKTKPYSLTGTALASASLPDVGENVRLINAGPNNCFVSIGPGAQTATLPNSTPTRTSVPVLAGTDIVLSIENHVQCNLSGICASGETATLYASVGSGI
jgi:hypothetical protein